MIETQIGTPTLVRAGVGETRVQGLNRRSTSRVVGVSLYLLGLG